MAEPMRAHVYEKAFLWAGAAMLVVFLGALLYASVAMGIHLPGRDDVIDPAQVRTIPPFDDPGVHQVGPNSYEVVMISSAWSFTPAEVRVPAGSEVTFLATSTDVLHGLHVDETLVNLMLIPGHVARHTYRFERPGEYLMLCHEYCGVGHHFMYGTVIVE